MRSRGVLLFFILVAEGLAGCGVPEIIRDRRSSSGDQGAVNGIDDDDAGGVIVGGETPSNRGSGTKDGDGTFSDAGEWVPGADGACFEAHQTPDRVTVDVTTTTKVPKPVAIFLMQDRSSSMVGLCDGQTCNANAWAETTAAVRAFASDPKSAGLDVGLGFFPPLGATGETQGACDGSSCAVPAVPIGKLPAVGSALVAALDGAVPSSSRNAPNYTPTECGMRGMVDYCKAHTAKTGEPCVAVLVTDGAPTRCSGDGPTLAKIVSDGKAAGVKSFTIGMAGANFALLDYLAREGGTDCAPKLPAYACDISKGDTLLAALNAIREFVSVTETHSEVQTKELECEWKIPKPPAGEVFDPARVNFEFTASSGKVERVGFVGSSAACKTSGDAGWYFDDAPKPGKILVCPSTCTAIKAAKDARVDIAFGCAREEAPVIVVR